MKCWGDNTYGQLGNGITGTNSNVPVDVLDPGSGTLSGVTGIAVGQYHTCAVVTVGVTEGIVYCWGRNNYGQLGNSNTGTDSPYPVQVTNLDGTSGVKSAFTIGAGYEHTCAVIKNNGGWSDSTAKCWGRNDNGQLGNGTLIGSNFPVVVSGLTFVQQTFPAISGGEKHTCAITGSMGSVSCWGSNSDGQLGQRASFSNPSSKIPLKVENSSGDWGDPMGNFSMGANHNLAVSNSFPWAWG
jgi:alpha-tubulin suppressor-like RCC1 family protein